MQSAPRYDMFKWILIPSGYKNIFLKYRSNENDMYESIEELDDMDKLGQGFTSADPLEEIDIGDGSATDRHL